MKTRQALGMPDRKMFFSVAWQEVDHLKPSNRIVKLLMKFTYTSRKKGGDGQGTK